MLPQRSSYFYEGAHGYEGTLNDMRGIFFAKGPGKLFNKSHMSIDILYYNNFFPYMDI